LARAAELEALPAGERGALFGIPFAVKDNIDVAGVPTTAACPAFSYVPDHSAFCVQRLLDAGAMLIGKTNLDQFATGLVGTRSPYPPPLNAFNAAFVPGGSSSGSAVAVAKGLVSFSLGTDTAGSGRVPAAMNNLVGVKPTRGQVSTSGVVPACRSLDCVSVFACEVLEATLVLGVMAGHDPNDPYSELSAEHWDPTPLSFGSFRFGIPRAEQLVFSDASSRQHFERSVARLRELGGTSVELDFSPFERTAAALYGGPWVAQRLEATARLLESAPEELHPITRQILEGALSFDAPAAYRAYAELSALERATLPTWSEVDLLCVPSIPGPVTIEQVAAEPTVENTRLGHYTNFVNLLGLCAIAVPSGLGDEGVPRGVTLIAQGGHDGVLAGIADRLHRQPGFQRGATGRALSPPQVAPMPPVRIVVAGAHMQGMPLNHELSSRGARLLERTKTAPCYQLFALATQPPKPGLVRMPTGSVGEAIDVEVWALAPSALGEFLSALPSPMCLGRVELEGGDTVTGFLCEPYATEASGLYRATLSDILRTSESSRGTSHRSLLAWDSAA
jgi:allophanate hydrolase